MTCKCASILKSSVNWNQRFFAVVENDETLCPNEKKCRLLFLCMYLEVQEEIPFFHHSTGTCFQLSNI